MSPRHVVWFDVSEFTFDEFDSMGICKILVHLPIALGLNENVDEPK